MPPNHLIIASLMASPGSLAISKTMFPETKKTKANWDAIKNTPKGLFGTFYTKHLIKFFLIMKCFK